jgi:hypothetical protein
MGSDPLTASRHRAAAKGRAVISRRAEIKRAIAAGDLDVQTIIASETTPDADAIKVDQLLRAVPGIGPLTASEIAEAANVPAGARLGDLPTPARQRLSVAIEEAI